MEDFKYMSGAGNTFLIGTELKITSDIEVISYVSDSKIDIDGVISVSVDNVQNNILNMEYYNADGSTAELCANGVRCAAKFAYDKKYFVLKKILVNTPSGTIETEIQDNNIVSSLLDYPTFPKGLNEYELEGYKGRIVNVGNPHFVIRTDNIDSIDIEKIGHKFQSIDMFPKGMNVELYIIKDNNNVNARVFERGVGETLACGSGAVAIFYSLLSKNLVSENIWINYPGGKLNLAIKKDKIYLSGEIIYL